jgi:hypothetical protein
MFDEDRSLEEISRDAEKQRKEWQALGRKKLQEKRRMNMDNLSRNVTPKQARFCHLVSLGMPMGQAMFEAGYHPKDKKSASEQANKLMKSFPVAKYYKELQETAFLANVLSLAEKRSYLADIVRTPIAKIDGHNKLAQFARYDENGNMTEVRMPSKLTAIELDAKLAGELSDTQVNVGIGLQLVNQRLEQINLPKNSLPME